MRVGAVIALEAGQIKAVISLDGGRHAAHCPGPRTSQRASNQAGRGGCAFPRHGGTSPAAAIAAARRYAPRRMDARPGPACLPLGPDGRRR